MNQINAPGKAATLAHYKAMAAQAKAEAEQTHEQVYCGACSGSGEGMYDGTTCMTCRGKGEVWQLLDGAEFDGDDEDGDEDEVTA
jgi:RecJ-like exonuclease